MKLYIHLLSVLCVCLCMSCSDIPEKEDKQNKTSKSDVVVTKVVTGQGDIINHNVYGDGATTLLFVHGWCIDQTYWSNQVAAFQNDYKIVTMDLHGFGKSASKERNWNISDFAEDVNAVIDQLNLKNVILIGHSMGGNVILEAALKNKAILALVGVDNFKDVGVTLNEEMQAEIDGFVTMLSENFSEIAPAYAEGYLFHESTDSLIVKRVKEDFKNSTPAVAVGSLKSLFESVAKEPDQLSKLTQKLHLINCNPTPTNPEGLNNTGVIYEVLEIKNSGHYPMIEKPEEFNRHLAQVLSKITSKKN